jgi:hypothetical protein
LRGRPDKMAVFRARNIVLPDAVDQKSHTFCSICRSSTRVGGRIKQYQSHFAMIVMAGLVPAIHVFYA